MDPKSIVDEIVVHSHSLKSPADLKTLIEKIKDRRVVMLGESSHGTQEFYEWRRLISNELIRHHGFHFIAVEGDWPSCQGVNRFIQGKASENSIKAITGFSRWPTWMWGNTEIMGLMDDLREWNERADDPVGFYGLDVYSLYESLEAVVRRLKELDPMLATKVQNLYTCFDPYRDDERSYVQSLYEFPDGCVKEVAMALKDILQSRLEDVDDVLDITQNAQIIQNAEKYYRTMITQEDDSWNVRDKHMMETLETLLDHYGPGSKCIIWAHNTHIGDYRATDMLVRGHINMGGLARQKFGIEQTALIGFTTYTGEVVASGAWDGPAEIMDVPFARTSSLEYVLHQAIPQVGYKNYYVDFTKVEEDSVLNDFIGHRAIGVVYDPELEHRGNYVPTSPAYRYDFLFFFNQTQAIRPLNIKFDREKMPETFPFGDRL